LARGLVVAVGVVQAAGEVLLLDSARTNGIRAVGVEHNLVLRVQVPALVDVDLAVPGPLGADHPEGWPSTACLLWEVREVGNEQARVVCVETLEPDTAPAVSVGAGSIDFDGHCVLGAADKTKVGRVLLVPVLDEALVWVLTAEELKLAEEVIRVVGLLELVALESKSARGTG